MFPFNFEWIWDAGHMLFMGGLWYALSILGLGLTYCIIKAILTAPKATGPVIIKTCNFIVCRKRLSRDRPGEGAFFVRGSHG